MMFAFDPRDLNPEQIAAVIEPSSIFLIACPGSGKTRTLTYKIAYELSRRTDKRIVVAITYTHRAADCCGQLKLATALEFFQYR
ncbi:UvrD-helicase domain-containing protein, partial [Leclercia adecarboxylata]